MKAYCQYPGLRNKNIAVVGIAIQKFEELAPNSIWEPTIDAFHFVHRAPTKNDLIILDGVAQSPCGVCKHRLIEITGGCKRCEFKNEEVLNTLLRGKEEAQQNVLSFLKENKVQELNVRHVITDSDFQSHYAPKEIEFDQVTIVQNQKKLSERSKNAAKSKAFKKSTCSACVFANESTRTCIVSEPRICRVHSEFSTEEEVKNKALQSVKDMDRLLMLSLLCGRTLRIAGKRYRLSYVKDEMIGSFVATQDYYPWTTRELTFKEVTETLEGANLVFESTDIKDMPESKKKEQAATYALIRRSWNSISSISGYQKQQMFWASYNSRKKRIDIEIHLSKSTYPYYFKTIKDLLTSTNFIKI